MLLAPEGTARASGFLSDQFGSDQGNPAMWNTYSVYFNPAAMAGMHGSEITLDGVFAARSLDYTRSPLALGQCPNPPYQGGAYYSESNTGKATLFNVLSAPYIGFVTDFGGSRWRLGIASYIPFGGEVSWGKNQAYAGSAIVPGGYDGPQRWSSISANTSSLYETAALAYRFEKARLGIGLSASVIRTGITDTRARNGNGTDDIVSPNGTIEEGRTYLDASGFQVGAAAGLQWEATKDGRLRFGASYTSQPNFGTMRLNGTFKYSAGLTAESTNNIDLLQAYPDVVRLGMAWRVTPQTELRLDGDWERWSQFQYQCVVHKGASCGADSHGVSTDTTNVLLDLPRDWKDTMKVRLGIAYWASPQAEIHASAFWNSPPVGLSHQDPLIFDSTRIGGTLGVRYGFNKHFYGALSYTYVYLVPVTVNNSAAPNNPLPSTSPSTNGYYTSELYIFDAALSYRF
ncbi:MAG: OmpP1/FadL family transporter [Polyangiaceae bacterium]